MNAPITAISRREFLKASGALIVSAAMPACVAEALAQSDAPAAAASALGGATKPALTPDQLDSWIAVGADGKVTAFFGKMDMGQSLDIAVAQIVADELD